MDPLATTIIEAHGGLDRWRSFERISAELTQDGALWQVKGKAGFLDRTAITASLTREWASHDPFGTPGRRTDFTPERVAILSEDRGLLEEMDEPRLSFAGHALETPWSDLQLAYFAGEAMWTYLNLPFVLADPDVESQELEPWSEAGEPWRRLLVRFPRRIATHSAEQILYVDASGLLTRHDYDVEIAGGTAAAQYVGGYRDVQGIMIPTERRIYPRQSSGEPMRDMLVVSIDLANIRLG